jgi:ZIP family zinc transporter
VDHRWQGVFYCLIAGVSMPIGAFIAWGAVGGTLSPIVFAILFGLIAGIMVFISVREIIPTGASLSLTLALLAFYDTNMLI